MARRPHRRDLMAVGRNRYRTHRAGAHRARDHGERELFGPPWHGGPSRHRPSLTDRAQPDAPGGRHRHTCGSCRGPATTPSRRYRRPDDRHGRAACPGTPGSPSTTRRGCPHCGRERIDDRGDRDARPRPPAPAETTSAPSETEPAQSTSNPPVSTGGGGGSSGGGVSSGSSKQSTFGASGSLGPGSSPNG